MHLTVSTLHVNMWRFILQLYTYNYWDIIVFIESENLETETVLQEGFSHEK